MHVISFFRVILIIILTIISGFLVVVTSYFPRNGLYSWVSKKLWGPGLLVVSGARLSVIGKNNLQTSRNMIYVSNHESHLDIPAIYRAIPVNLYFVAKEELKKVPFLGWAMQSVGTVFVNRKDRSKAMKSLEEAGQLIAKGKSVISFPEGTRSKTGKLSSFKKGTFIMARAGNVDIVPLGVEGTYEVISPNSKKFTPGNIVVSIGEPIHTDEYNHLSIDEFAEFVKIKVKEQILLAEQFIQNQKN